MEGRVVEYKNDKLLVREFVDEVVMRQHGYGGEHISYEVPVQYYWEGELQFETGVWMSYEEYMELLAQCK